MLHVLILVDVVVLLLLLFEKFVCCPSPDSDSENLYPTPNAIDSANSLSIPDVHSLKDTLDISPAFSLSYFQLCSHLVQIAIKGVLNPNFRLFSFELNKN